MTVPAATLAEVLKFAGRPTPLPWDRFHFRDKHFTILRRAVRGIIMALCEEGDEDLCAVARQLQLDLGIWLTTPCRFDAGLALCLRSVLGEPEAASRRWGGEIASNLMQALDSAARLSAVGNPLRREAVNELCRLQAEGRRFRVYCSRSSRMDFEEAVAERGGRGLNDEHFIHTARAYRECPAFDVLVKVGPLRAYGIGCAPDALLSAPRYGNLVQFIWDGTADDPDFGFDPVSLLLPTKAGCGHNQEEQANVIEVCGFRWRSETIVIRSGEEEGEAFQAEEPAKADDLSLISGRAAADPLRRAVLVHVSGNRGILYPLQARALAVATSALGLSLDDRVAGEELSAGMFLVVPDARECGAWDAATNARVDSAAWKQLLNRELRWEPERLIRRLRAAGIGLASLPGALEHWANPPSTVIHAPQSRHHFMILMKALGELHSTWSNEELWKKAWAEVLQSRSHAIQAGMHEHERLHERFLSTLTSMKDDIWAHIQDRNDFILTAPVSSGLIGNFQFMRVEAVEDGYRVPYRETQILNNVASFREWLI